MQALDEKDEKNSTEKKRRYEIRKLLKLCGM